MSRDPRFAPSQLVIRSAFPRFVLAEWLPRFLIVIRNDFPSGAEESEKGNGAHQKPFVRNRQTKNWPGAARRVSQSVSSVFGL